MDERYPMLLSSSAGAVWVGGEPSVGVACSVEAHGRRDAVPGTTVGPALAGSWHGSRGQDSRL